MCVIISKRVQGKLDSEIAAKSILLNPDGFGILLTDSGEVYKTMDPQEAYDWLQTERPYVFHARLATVGPVNMDNTQPIKINEKCWLFHNGTVQTPRSWDTSMSDSRFVAETLRSISGHSWRDILSLTDSRFLTSLSTKQGVRTSVTGKWFKRDNIFFSKENVLKGELVAVYGTLRRGYGNNHYLNNAQYLGTGKTKDNLRMVCEGIPFVLSGDHEAGDNLKVEVYLVPKESMPGIDQLEGHPEWYQRKKTTVYLDGSIPVEPWLYFNDQHSPENSAYYNDFADYKQPNYAVMSTDNFMFDEHENKYFDLNAGEYVDDAQIKMF